MSAHSTSEIDANDSDVIFVDVEKTFDYISGRLTFEEYSDILERGIKEEPPDETEEEVSSTLNSEDVESCLAGGERLSAPSPRPVRRCLRKLPKHLEGLLGEANAKFAHNQTEEAERMCLEVIRSAPNFPQPFRTLAMIYEERQEIEKCLQFMLIAAHLSKRDADEWKRVGEMYLELDNISQAAMCFEKAARARPKDLSLWYALCELLSKMNESRRLLDCRQQILSNMPQSESAEYMVMARYVVKEWHGMGEKDKALAVMVNAFKVHPEAVKMEDINVLLDLYFVKSVYDQSLLVLVQHCSVCLHYELYGLYDATASRQDPLPDEKPLHCAAPVDMLVDLRTKLIICLIHLRYYDCIDDVLSSMLSENPESTGDLYLDIIDAFMSTGRFISAKPLLAILVQTSTYNMAAVWLRYAECLTALQLLTEAECAYFEVVKLAPNHCQARLALSSIQLQLGNSRQALATLQFDGELPAEPGSSSSIEPDIKLLLARCHVLHSEGLLRQFADAAKQVLFNFCFKIFYNEKYRSTQIEHKQIRHRNEAYSYLILRGFDRFVLSTRLYGGHGSITVEELFLLYERLCAALHTLKEHVELETVTVLALLCPAFFDAERTALTENACMCACLMNRNSSFAYGFVRDLCLSSLESSRAWNTFAQILTLTHDLRHNRFCIRQAMKHPCHYALIVLNGNNALISGSYKHALGEYTAALRYNSSDPLVTLLVALCFVHMACQKFATRQHSLVVQATAFLNQYLELRGECQETHYNLGRAFHQLGLIHFAADHYRKGLSLPPAVSGDVVFDLRPELAFNLCLIYRNSKSFDLARQITQQYLVV